MFQQDSGASFFEEGGKSNTPIPLYVIGVFHWCFQKPCWQIHGKIAVHLLVAYCIAIELFKLHAHDNYYLKHVMYDVLSLL